MDVVLTHQVACRSLESLNAGIDGSININFHQEMDTATQVKPQVHRQSMQFLQPLRCIGQQVECNTVGWVFLVGIQGLFKDFLCFELSRCISKTHLDGGMHAISIKIQSISLKTIVFHQPFNLPHHLGVDFHSGFDAAYLDGRRFTKEIRGGIDQPENNGKNDKEIFPERITVHNAKSMKCFFSGWDQADCPDLSASSGLPVSCVSCGTAASSSIVSDFP